MPMNPKTCDDCGDVIFYCTCFQDMLEREARERVEARETTCDECGTREGVERRGLRSGIMLPLCEPCRERINAELAKMRCVF